MNYKTLISGLSTYIPGLYNYIVKIRNSSSGGATRSARYCYSVWLRHLITAKKNNLIKNIPDTIAELGPGDSLGVGLAALLSGSTKYYALDVVSHANLSGNLSVLYELIELFNNRESVPDDNEWPDLFPKLDNYEFPRNFLTDKIIDAALMPERITAIKNTLINREIPSSEIIIKYFVPWNKPDVIFNNSVDLVLSQAVMEHVDNINDAYSAIYQWLSSGGCMSMEIDFSNHVMAYKWNEQWRYSNFIWNKIIWGNRPYSLNRQPHSVHISMCKKNHFTLICDYPQYDFNGITRLALSKEFGWITNEDLVIKSALIQCVK